VIEESREDEFRSFDHEYFKKEYIKYFHLLEETIQVRFRDRGAKGTNFEF
jgi:hypothetical protein